jgi:hypothetical protein
MENSEVATKVCGEAPYGFALDQGAGRDVFHALGRDTIFW